MEHLSFVFTIFFMLLGPVKLIPAFAGVVREKDDAFRRAVAIRAALVATGVVVFVALAGGTVVSKYHISLDGLRLAGGLVLLVAALNTIFPKAQPPSAQGANATPLQLAVSPLATPIIVPPAGVAAILIFTMLAAEYPGMKQAVAISLAVIMVLDLLVMVFNRTILKVPGLMLVLQILGAVLIFMQVALAVETILVGLRHLGAFRA